MPVAVRTDITLTPTVTQANLIASLVTAFGNAGYSTAIDNYTSGSDRLLVYQFDTDSSRLLGSNFIRVRVTNTLQVFTCIGTGYNLTTKAITNISTEVNLGTIATNLTVNFVSLNASNEARLVLITQNTLFIPLGLLIPANRPTWWNLDSWSYAFFFSNTAMTTLNSSAVSPYNNQNYELITSTRLSGVNSHTNQRDILTGLILVTASNFGVAGKTSDDLAIACGGGSTRYDTLTFSGSTQRFLLVANGVSGVAIRVQ